MTGEAGESEHRQGDRLLLPGGTVVRTQSPSSAAAWAADAERSGSERRSAWRDVPWRTIVGAIGLVFLALLLIAIVYLASRIVIWTVIAGFFAVVLARPVDIAQRRLGLRRGAAIGLVAGATLVVVAGLGTIFVLPVRTQLIAVLTDLPGTVRQAAEGQGPVGRIVTRLHIEQLVKDNEDRLTTAAQSVQNSIPSAVAAAAQAVIAVVTIFVMACLMLSQSAAISEAATKIVPMRHRARFTEVARSASGAISGYVIGNLVISVCAGSAAFVVLLALRVPSPAVLALWVAVADLIPLVGATIGAVVAVIAALFVSPTAGIVAIVFFALYQQFENSVLQVVVMARTVRVNPLVVLLSVLLGVELFGFVGALLGVPVAGAASVVLKGLWQSRPIGSDQLVVVAADGSNPTPSTAPPKPRRRLLRWRRSTN